MLNASCDESRAVLVLLEQQHACAGCWFPAGWFSRCCGVSLKLLEHVLNAFAKQHSSIES